MLMEPSRPRRGAWPHPAKPLASRERTAMIEKASCSSKKSISSGRRPACAYAFRAERAAADSQSGLGRSWMAIVSVAEEEPAVGTSGGTVGETLGLHQNVG